MGTHDFERLRVGATAKEQCYIGFRTFLEN